MPPSVKISGGLVMAADWRTVALGELVEVFDGPHATPKKTSEGPIFLGISNLIEGRIDLTRSEHLSEQDLTTWTRRVTPKAGDLVFSYETRLGQAALIPEGLRCCLGRRMGLLRVRDRSKTDPQFLLYAYLGPLFQETIRQKTIHGSTVDRIALIELPSFPIRVPSFTTQRYIAHILSTLDDKINLNRRMNQTLEAMVQALFRSWFVDFDPVRAKAEGRHPEGMDAQTAALFPSRLVKSVLGVIPEGWSIRMLRDITTKIGSGATPRGGSLVYADAGTAFIRSQNVFDDGFRWDGLVKIDDDAAAQLSGVSVREGDILFNITGESVTRTCIVDPSALPARVSQHVAIIRPSLVSGPYLLLFLRERRTKDYLMGLDTGATRKAVTKGHLETTPVLCPTEEVLTRFTQLAAPLFRRCELNNSQARALGELRDALLPKLLSGEISVRDAKAQRAATA
ncbi:MAG: restriction endonuclease subunit S [Verrucomicrobiaceae bacterium]|nr:MAG: restriction endonuclease subunit S [Verrucomicrobiaceae bacterium]